MAKQIEPLTGSKNLDSFMADIVQKKFQKAKLYDKDTSSFMWFLYYVSFMWIWQKRFMKGYHTTIGYSVYVSQLVIINKLWESLYKTMRHEFIHMLQNGKYGLLYNLSYLFPQILAVGSLLALLAIWFSNWWLMSLCALAFLAPLPAPWRTKWEIEGYTQSMLVLFEESGEIPQERIDNIIKHFTSMDYFMMCPFKGWITKRIEGIATQIRAKEIQGIFLSY